MGLTSEDRRWVEDAMRSSEERTYKRIKEGALSELRKDMDAGFASVNGRIDGVAEDVAKIPVIEGELREMNGSLQAIRDHLGA